MISSKMKLGAVALGVLLLSTTTAMAHEGKDRSKPDHAGHAMANAEAGSKELHRIMTSGAAQAKSMSMKGDTDVDFVRMMRDHHRQAIKMADVELAHGDNAKAKEMARRMRDAQSKEILELEAWLAANSD